MAKRAAKNPRSYPHTSLHAVHWSLQKTRISRAPGDLTAITMSVEEAEFLQRQSLEIFTIMSNAGYPFATALGAVLLTGMNWGSNSQREIDSSRKKDIIHV